MAHPRTRFHQGDGERPRIIAGVDQEVTLFDDVIFAIPLAAATALQGHGPQSLGSIEV